MAASRYNHPALPSQSWPHTLGPCPPFLRGALSPCSPFAVLFQKLSIADRPLYLRLLAGPDTDVLSFVLKENETGEVEVGPGPWPVAQTQPSGHMWWVAWAPSHYPAQVGACSRDLRKWGWGEPEAQHSRQHCKHPGGEQVGACVWQGLWKDRISHHF